MFALVVAAIAILLIVLLDPDVNNVNFQATRRARSLLALIAWCKVAASSFEVKQAVACHGCRDSFNPDSPLWSLVLLNKQAFRWNVHLQAFRFSRL